jgi:hypothetical protein
MINGVKQIKIVNGERLSMKLENMKLEKISLKNYNIPAKINGKINPEYSKAYYQNHKEHKIECSKKYHKIHKKHIQKQAKIYRQTHKEQIKEYSKNYRKTHKEQIKLKYIAHREQHKEYNKKYYQTHKEQYKEYYKTHKEKWGTKEYLRNHVLTSTKLNNGKKIICNKRHYPLDNACELCGKTNIRLVYHHWNNEYLEFGIWVCFKECHWLIEGLELPNYEQLKNKYLNLKQIIEKGIKIA